MVALLASCLDPVRTPGQLRFVQSVLPEPLTPLFVLLTRLGNPVLITVMAVTIYLVGTRRDEIDRTVAAHLLGLIIGGIALVTAIKYGLACPRPPETFHRIPVDGYGFPSGHAASATIGYLSVAVVLPWQSRRGALGLAGVLIVTVATSRVALGVHYPIDVLIGVIAGGIHVGLVDYTGRGKPHRTFAIASGIGLVAGIIAWPSFDAAAAAGGPVGAAIVWWTTRNYEINKTGPVLPLLTLFAVGSAAVAMRQVDPHPYVQMTVFLLCGAAVVGVPVVGSLAEDRPVWPR